MGSVRLGKRLKNLLLLRVTDTNTGILYRQLQLLLHLRPASTDLNLAFLRELHCIAYQVHQNLA